MILLENATMQTALTVELVGLNQAKRKVAKEAKDRKGCARMHLAVFAHLRVFALNSVAAVAALGLSCVSGISPE
jgi:hypothetical protein